MSMSLVGEKTILTCVSCSKVFEPISNHFRRFCDDSCRILFYRAVRDKKRAENRWKPTKAECPACLRPFDTKTYSHIYCTVKCRQNSGRKRNVEYQLGVRRLAREEQSPRFLLYRAKYRAKLGEIPFDLTVEDLVIPEICPVLHIPLIWNLGTGKRGYHPNSVSVDRIKSELGYTKENVRVISARANLLKNNASIEELELVLDDLKALRREGRF